MATPLESRVKEFLQRASTELRRTGDEMKSEAQRLITDLRDPAQQARLREQLEEARVWVRQVTNEAVEVVQAAAKKVEQGLPQAIDEALGRKSPAKKAPRAAKPAAEEAPPAPRKAKPAAEAAKKTVGRKPAAKAGARPQGGAKVAAPKAKPAAKATPAAKKTVGRAKAPKAKGRSGGPGAGS